MKWAAYGGFWRREFAANQGAGAVVATSFFRSTCQLKGGYLDVELNDGKDADHLLSFPHGVDIPVRRVASGFRTRRDRSRVSQSHKDVPRCIRRLHDADNGADYDVSCRIWPPADWAVVAHRLHGARECQFRCDADDHLLVCPHGLAVHENKSNLIVDFHLVYAGVLTYLVVKRAGHVFGLDGWAENLEFFKQHPALKPLVA